MMKIATWFERDKALYLVAMTASLLLSLWLGYSETVINPDGICYLLSAQMVGMGSISDVTHLCPQSQWPFYSLLIYAVAQVSHLSFSAAAYLLNAVFSIISVLTFILIVKELGGSRRALWLAALVILLNHQFIAMREYIIRDHGFWAAYLCSVYLLLRYFRKPLASTALAWFVSLAIATLFRIEGAIFILTMPWLAWFDFSSSMKQRVKHFFMLNLPVMVLAIVAATWLMGHPQYISKLGRFAEISHQFRYGMTTLIEHYQASKAALIQYILTQNSASDAGAVLLAMWLGWYLFNVVTALSWTYAALVLYAWWQQVALFTSRARVVVWGYALVNIIVTACFLFETSLLSKRYLIALTLILMLWVPFALENLLNKAVEWRHRVALFAAVILISLGSLSGIINFGHSKTYIHEAGDWIAENVPTSASLYANDMQLMYYSQHYGMKMFGLLPHYINVDSIAQGGWQQYEYLALRISRHNQLEMASVINELHLAPIREFVNKRGDKIAIYKVKREEKVS